MKLLVTGGAGYLGSELARQHDVVVTWLRTKPTAARGLRVDLADAAEVDRAFAAADPDVVVHTAYRQAEEHLQRDVIDATTNVARACAALDARLVYVSTDLVFDGDVGAPYVEADEPRTTSAYGRAKLEAERIAMRLHPDTLVVRTSLLYGNPGGPQERLALRDDVVFFADEIRTPIHVVDLAGALLELAAGPATGILHVAGPDPLSRYDFARKLAAAQGRDPAALRSGQAPPGRAGNVALDSTCATALLRRRIRGIDEALAGR